MKAEYIVRNGKLYCKKGDKEVEIKCTVEAFLEIVERQGF